MKLNESLLLKVRDHILAEPRRYWQATFGEKVSKSESPCGTQACIAGWALRLSGRISAAELFKISAGQSRRNPFVEGAKVLGLSNDRAHRLFSGGTGDWPEPFGTQYRQAHYFENDKVKAARAAADLLNEVIRSNGKVLDRLDAPE